MDITSPVSSEVSTNSEMLKLLPNTENYENVTLKPESEIGITEMENTGSVSFKVSTNSEMFTPLPNTENYENITLKPDSEIGITEIKNISPVTSEVSTNSEMLKSLPNIENYENVTLKPESEIEIRITKMENTGSVSFEVSTNSEMFTPLPNTENYENITLKPDSEIGLTEMENTSSVSFEVSPNSETFKPLLNTENYENVTLKLDIEMGITDIKNSTWKLDLISEELNTLENDSSVINITDCGVWDENAGIVNIFDSQNFFMQWPALGYLRMISEHRMCASVLVSSKFVITSLNCIALSNNQLDPDKWVYIGGLNANISSNGTQSHLVSKIIPYSVQHTPSLFKEHEVALVEVQDTIIIDEYSQHACIPKNFSVENVCFVTGWNTKTADGDFPKQFYSIPLSVIPPEECNNTMNYNGMLLDSLICGRNYNESLSLCQMDLGSPLLCLNENQQWEIKGILNFPRPCDTTKPSLFNSIQSIRKWILDIITNPKLLQ